MRNWVYPYKYMDNCFIYVQNSGLHDLLNDMELPDLVLFKTLASPNKIVYFLSILYKT